MFYFVFLLIFLFFLNSLRRSLVLGSASVFSGIMFLLSLTTLILNTYAHSATVNRVEPAKFERMFYVTIKYLFSTFADNCQPFIMLNKKHRIFTPSFVLFLCVMLLCICLRSRADGLPFSEKTGDPVSLSLSLSVPLSLFLSRNLSHCLYVCPF